MYSRYERERERARERERERERETERALLGTISITGGLGRGPVTGVAWPYVGWTDPGL